VHEIDRCRGDQGRCGFLVQAILFRGDFPYLPIVVVPGALAAIIGLVLLGVATTLSAEVLPR
jgi:hypothetical protein